MKVTEVIFKRNYAISPLTHEHMHLGATVVVEENESPEEALKLAQKTVEDFYKQAMQPGQTLSVASEYAGYLTEPHDLPVINYKEQDKKEKNIELLASIITTIDSCPNKKMAERVVEVSREFLEQQNSLDRVQTMINNKFN